MHGFVFEHFWAVGVVVICVNVLIARFRMRELIAGGSMSAADANRFCLGAAIVFAIVFGSLEVEQQLTGIPMHCRFSLPVADRTNFPKIAIGLLSGGALVYWVWRRGGDRTLALFGPAFTRRSVSGKKYTPRQVRWVITGPSISQRSHHLLAAPTWVPPLVPRADDQSRGAAVQRVRGMR
jgi:hypothetical protein